MPTFRKIPKEVFAVQLTWKDWNDVCELLGDALLVENPDGAWNVESEEDVADTIGESSPWINLKIRTINNQVVTVRHGDWIVPDGEPGRFYPIDPKVFRESFEEVT